MFNNRMGTMPVIRIELESMQQSICHAFTEHIGSMDTQMQEAVKAFCTPENIQSIIDAQVSRVLKSAIESEISHFYTYGDGREAVKKAIRKRLDDNETRLDY